MWEVYTVFIVLGYTLVSKSSEYSLKFLREFLAAQFGLLEQSCICSIFYLFLHTIYFTSTLFCCFSMYSRPKIMRGWFMSASPSFCCSSSCCYRSSILCHTSSSCFGQFGPNRHLLLPLSTNSISLS